MVLCMPSEFSATNELWLLRMDVVVHALTYDKLAAAAKDADLVCKLLFVQGTRADNVLSLVFVCLHNFYAGRMCFVDYFGRHRQSYSR